VLDAADVCIVANAECAFNWRWDTGDIIPPSESVFKDGDAARMAAFIESTRKVMPDGLNNASQVTSGAGGSVRSRAPRAYAFSMMF